MDLSIIIVNWNSADDLRRCLASVRKEAHGPTLEIVVVDNASYDGCADMLPRDFPDVVFVQSPANLGFGRANNLGVSRSHGRALLFLNPDTEVVGAAVSELHRQFSATADAGAMICKLLNSDGTVQASALQSFPTLTNQILDSELLRRWFPNSRLWGIQGLRTTDPKPVVVEAVSGACLMVGRDTFQQVGGFSPEYFMYGEDVDLCYKLAKTGRRNYYFAGASVVHHGGTSSARKEESQFSSVMMRESIARFLRKHRGALAQLGFRGSLSVAAIGRLMLLGGGAPLFLARNGRRKWRSACRKWWAILRWGLGLAPWVRQYAPGGVITACPDERVVRTCVESAGN